MSYKFGSLMKILNMLDSGKKVTVHSLMDDLEISERSVHRYLNTLQTGFPFYYDRKKGSYCFDEGYSLRKPDISVEESLALALAKKVLKNFGTGVEKGLQGIEEKLSTKKEGVPQHIILKADELSSSVKNHLDMLHQAIVNYKTIELTYKGIYSSRESVRYLDPYYLFFHDDIWYLRGYCHLKNDVRTFALDRIISVRTLNKNFIPKDISPEDDLSGAFGPVVSGKPVEVVLRFDAEIKPFVIRKKWHQSQKVKELKNGSIEVRFRVNGIEGIKTWIYRWLPHVEVVAPKKLKEIIRAELRTATKKI